MTETCPEQERLRAVVHDILQQIDKLNREQIDALNAWDYERLMAIDKELESLIGSKERAYGALFQHRNDHAC
jgi:hypothetical protein